MDKKFRPLEQLNFIMWVVMKNWRKLHKEELIDLYPLPNIVQEVKIKKNEMGGACGMYGGGERCAQGSGGET